MRWRNTAVLLGIAFAALLVIGRLALAFGSNQGLKGLDLMIRSYFWGTERFDSSTWADEHRTTSRASMLFDLLISGALDGRSMTDITKLLGQPDRVGDGVSAYEIGSVTGVGFDADELRFFHTSGEITRWSVSQT